MKLIWLWLMFSMLVGLCLGPRTVKAQDPQGVVTPAFTPTPTPSATPYYNFVIPVLQVPIVLPTAFELPPKTPLYVNYTPAPNLNPYGLQTDQFALHMIAEMLNLQQATLDVMGVVGWIMDFLITMFLLMGSMGLLFALFRRGVWAVMYVRSGDYGRAWQMSTSRKRLYGKEPKTVDMFRKRSKK